MKQVEVQVRLVIDGAQLISQTNSAQCATSSDAVCLVDSAQDGLDAFVGILDVHFDRFPTKSPANNNPDEVT